MISGARPALVPTTTRARGTSPEPLDRRSARDEDRGGAVVQRAGVARRDDRAAGDDRAEAREHLEGRLGARSLVDEHLAAVRGHAHDLGLEPPGGDGGRGPLLAAQGEGVGVLAGDAVDTSDLLGRLGHRVGGLVASEQLGVREPPADRRVVGGTGSRPRLVGLRLHPRRTRHGLDTAGDDQVGVAGADGLGGPS
jgi:hypothetical protein